MATTVKRQTATTKAPTTESDLDKCLGELKAAGLEAVVHEYSHAYVDVNWKDAEGTRHKREFRPDGSELLRDYQGKEQKA